MMKVVVGFREDGKAIVRTVDNRRKFTDDAPEVGWLRVSLGMVSFSTVDDRLYGPGEMALPARKQAPEAAAEVPVRADDGPPPKGDDAPFDDPERQDVDPPKRPRRTKAAS